MNKHMIVVADSVRARIFTTDSVNDPLMERETLSHPEGRLHDREITSDLPGKDAGSGMGTGHTYETETDPKKHEVTLFAKRVASHLNDARNANQFAKLLIVADPTFLGELRAQLSSQTSEKVVFELNKNLTKMTAEEIRGHLPEFLSH